MKAGTQFGWLGRVSSLALLFSFSKMYPQCLGWTRGHRGYHTAPRASLGLSFTVSEAQCWGGELQKLDTLGSYVKGIRGRRVGQLWGDHFKSSGLEQGREGGWPGQGRKGGWARTVLPGTPLGEGL